LPKVGTIALAIICMASILFNVFLLITADKLSLRLIEPSSENERPRGEYDRMLKE